MRSLVDKAKGAVDIRQFARFFVGGVAGAAANLLAVYFVRKEASYQVALAAGVVVGFVVSFFMSKLFAFQSRSLSRTHGELVRFVMVYFFGIGCLAVISWILGRHVLPQFMAREPAEMLGAFCGAASMTVTSYFGHRYFTYRHVLVR